MSLSEAKPLIRIVRMEFRPEEVEPFLRLFETVKGRIRSFPGCRDLYLLRDDEQANVLFTYSVWESSEALAHYRNSTLFRETWKATRVLFAAPAQAHSMIELQRIAPLPST
ncbi:MAG TPA: antibiotic biosynthesis monooxygenase [Pseudomonadota bacterium]|nr:antibiotic biosynthesis monooxygenase [Pseudomonadota bacterium]